MYQIRQATPNDIPEIIEVVKSSWLSVYPKFIPLDKLEKLSAQRHSVELFYQEMFVQDSYNPLVVDQNNQIVGMALVFNFSEPRQGFIRRFYFLPQFQGQGLGTMLIQHLVEQYRTADFLSLEVEELNQAAVKFYQKNHFQTYRQVVYEIEGSPLNYFQMIRITKPCF